MKKTILTICLTLFVVFIVAIVIPLRCGYKIVYYTKVIYDFEAISAVSQSVGVIITAVLTLMIILQSKTIAKNQLEFEKKSSDNQLQFEKNSATNQEVFLRRQIRIELFERRVIIFEWIFKLFTNISIIVELQKDGEYTEQKLNQIVGIFKNIEIQDKYNNDIYFLHRAEYLFPKNIAEKMREIFNLFTKIKTIVRIASEDKIDITALNHEFYTDILKSCNQILKFQNFIHNTCNELLNISEFD